ncbi:MAG: class III poly(R)-hydroxyalkanoic acid synthase subunit PhaE [Rudaea sp.]
MSEKKSPQDWMADWQALQKQYWSAWSDATRNSAGQTPDTGTPWHEGLEQWSRMFSGAGKQNETLDRLMAGARSYTALMQSMIAAAGQPNGGGDPKAWAEALRNGFNLAGSDATLVDNPLAKMLRDIAGPGAQGIEQLSSSFAPFLAQARQEGLSWLNAPAFGYAREHQEHYQKSAAALVEYQDALNRYNALILKSSQRSFVIFENKLAERDEPGRRIDSPRALYDLWVDAAEEAWAEVALSDDFRKVYGDVVNAQMRVRAQVQAEVERIGTDLGMPTRSELNSVHKRLHELRRVGNGETGVADLHREVGVLRAEIAALKKHTSPPPSPRQAAARRSRNKAVKTSKSRN